MLSHYKASGFSQGLFTLSRPGSPTGPAIYQVASDKLLNI
jgi:hypothetical protein